MVSCDNLILLCATIETKLYNIVCTRWPFVEIIGGKTKKAQLFGLKFWKGRHITQPFIQTVDSSQSSLFTISTLNLFSLNLTYHKVPSSRLSWLVAHPSIFRLFIKGKFDALTFGPTIVLKDELSQIWSFNIVSWMLIIWEDG